MFKNLGQLKTYLQNIDNFDQFYIIQQGGRGVTREQVITQLEKAIAKDTKGVFDANKKLWIDIGIETPADLERVCRAQGLSQSPAFQSFRNTILITK